MVKDETKQQQKDVDVELQGCIAYPAGEGCPLQWCRQNRGDWCKDWRTGRICKNKRDLMDILSVIFGFIVGLMCGMSMALERYYHWLDKERKRTIVLKADSTMVMFVPSESMKDCQFVGIERMRTKDK